MPRGRTSTRRWLACLALGIVVSIVVAILVDRVIRSQLWTLVPSLLSGGLVAGVLAPARRAREWVAVVILVVLGSVAVVTVAILFAFANMFPSEGPR
jgi:hypothetical protein